MQRVVEGGSLPKDVKKLSEVYQFLLREAIVYHATLKYRYPGCSVVDQEAPFMRTGSEEEVNEYWVKVRSDLTRDYKRKRKDAVRRQNKLAAKRTRHR